MLILIAGCTTSSPRSRGSLSGAMDKARDDNEGSREVPDEPDPWWESDEDKEEEREDSSPSKEDTVVNTDPFDGSYLVMLRFGGSLSGTPYYEEQNGLELVLGMDDETPLDLLFFAGIHYMKTDQSHDVYESIGEGALLLNIGGDIRYYPLDKMSFFSPYVGARIGGIYMSWSYENPLTAGDDTIFSDSLGGLSLGVCAGVDLFKTEHFRLGAQIMPIVYLFGGETTQGFYNDYFGAQGMIRVNLEGGLRF
ncbi:MAG: hypothetical protein PQJ60_09630 [Spirochaetales bacterium]|nr:hypothetical protein [Spirochaetales bacterium]